MLCKKSGQFYVEIFDYLRDRGIDRDWLFDVFNKVDVGYHGVKMLSSEKLPWVNWIFNRYVAEIDAIFDKFTEQFPSKLLFQAPYSVGYAFNSFANWDSSDKIFSARANYSCLFPNQLVYLSGQFRSWDSGYWSSNENTLFSIPVDFLIQLFALQPALEVGLVLLVPSAIKHRDFEEVNSSLWSMYHTRQEDSVIEFEANGFGYEALSKMHSSQFQQGVTSQLIRTPWVHGVNLSRFVDLVAEYPDEFVLYSSCFRRFISGKFSSEDIAEQWIEELAHASYRLDLALKKHKKKLVSDGIDVAVGSVCTIGSLLLPPPFNTFLPAVVASKSAIDGIKWLRNLRDIELELSSDEYWLLWKAIET
jgi:hypothetical protein